MVELVELVELGVVELVVYLLAHIQIEEQIEQLILVVEQEEEYQVALQLVLVRLVVQVGQVEVLAVQAEQVILLQ